MCDSVFIFTVSWRGFLLGGRRSWHAHHRGGVLGSRKNYLLATPAVQHAQLVTAVALATAVLTRGAHLWGFGFVSTPQTYLWGRLFGEWRPGSLSNYFYVRVRRVHFARRVAKLLKQSHRGRRTRVRRVAKLATRWGRLRQGGRLPHNTYTNGFRTGHYRGYASVISNFGRQGTGHPPVTRRGRWWLSSPWHASPYHSWAHPRYLRQWWRLAKHLPRRVRTIRPVRWFFTGGATSTDKIKLLSTYATAATWRGRRRTIRPVLKSYSVWLLTTRTPRVLQTYRIPFVYSRRRRTGAVRTRCRVMSWPNYFPAAVVAGGLSLVSSNLIHEVNAGGLPLLHFGGTNFVPTAAVWHVNWNQKPDSLHGVKWLLSGVYCTGHRISLLHVLWRRLLL